MLVAVFVFVAGVYFDTGVHYDIEFFSYVYVGYFHFEF